MLIFDDAPSVSSPGPEVCSRCGGLGTILIEDEPYECTCAFSAKRRRFLGDDIYDSERIASTPLLSVTKDQKWTTIDRTKQSLWITSEWSALLPHLRFALGEKWRISGRVFTFRIITDEQLRAAHFTEGRRDSEGRRNDGEPVASLISPNADLLILRLGFLGHKNEAAPGILLAALRTRIEVLDRPVWVIDTPALPFRGATPADKTKRTSGSPAHLCWSDEAERFLVSKRFARIRNAP